MAHCFQSCYHRRPSHYRHSWSSCHGAAGVGGVDTGLEEMPGTHHCQRPLRPVPLHPSHQGVAALHQTPGLPASTNHRLLSQPQPGAWLKANHQPGTTPKHPKQNRPTEPGPRAEPGSATTVGSKTFSHVHCPLHIGPRRATSRVKHFGIVISSKATCYSHRSYSLLDEISVWPCSFSDHWPISMTLLKNDGVIFLVKGSEIMFPPPTHLT